MRAAIIDLGTNTFNLLVFEKSGREVEVIHAERQAVGLGLGGINEQRIAQDAKERALSTLHYFKQKASSFFVEEFKAFGTSALRDATNREEFLSQVRIQTGISVEVIDGLREADLIYKGVRSAHAFTNSTCIMDIGGGSTEFIFVAPNQAVTHSQSCNIGVARTIQHFDLSDPLTSADQTKLIQYFDENSKRLFTDRTAHTLVGASGSFDTFLALTGEDNPSTTKSHKMEQGKLLHVLDQLIHSNQEERNQEDAIIPIRKKMIHLSALKTSWVIRRLGIQETYVSPASLKEGVMWEMMGEL